MAQPITPALADSFADTLIKQYPTHSVVQRAVTMNGIYAASENNFLSRDNTTVFSDEIETGSVTNQKDSGRCWLFATLNTIRHQIAKDYKMDDLELSESYSYFWDKLEKSNSFYEHIIATAADPLDDRHVAYILNYPQGDGGWWEYAAGIITKYGVVPKTAMPEAKTTSESHQMNVLLDRKLRKDALALRKLVENKATDAQIQKQKESMLAEVYQYLTIAIGTPPKAFDFVYKDKDKKYHRDTQITPLEFLKKYATFDAQQYVSVVNDPNKKDAQAYCFEDGGNIVDGIEPLFLNVDMVMLKKLAHAHLQKGEAIWFGCDVMADTNRKGFMSLDTYDFNGTFGIDLTLSKAERLQSHDSSVNHAMTITGVDVVDGTPKQWKVENSWGEERGLKGYYTMSDEWFDKNGYIAVIRRDLLDEALTKALTEEPLVMAPWDPLNAAMPNASR